jgi:phosphatidate cytidylyltransferase
LSVPGGGGSAAPDADAAARRRAVWIRLVGSPILLGFVLAVLGLHDRTGDPLATDLLLFLVGAGAAYEMVRLLRTAGHLAHPLVAALAAGLLAGLGLLAPADPLLRLELRAGIPALAVFVLLLLHVRDTRPEAAEPLVNTLFVVVYVGLLLSFTREVAGEPASARMLAWFVLVAKASDMGGWIVGKPFGRHKMIPSVSPGKSWEGLAGGLLGSVLVAVLLPGPLGFGPREWGVLRLAAFGLVVGGASVLAGIFHSAWKRRLGAKDSSRILPEIGGLLDMVDSLLLAGPTAWLWLRLGG